MASPAPFRTARVFMHGEGIQCPVPLRIAGEYNAAAELEDDRGPLLQEVFQLLKPRPNLDLYEEVRVFSNTCFLLIYDAPL